MQTLVSGAISKTQENGYPVEVRGHGSHAEERGRGMQDDFVDPTTRQHDSSLQRNA